MRPLSAALAAVTVVGAAVTVPAVTASALPQPAPTAAATPRWTPPLPTWWPRPTTTATPRPTATPTGRPTATPTTTPTTVPTTAPPAPTVPPVPPVPSPTGDARHVVRVDASQAPTYATNVDEALAAWNTAVPSLRLVRAAAGESADVHIDEGRGWPWGSSTRPGVGAVHIGSDALDQGFAPTRVVAHELGHVLGLPDRRTGRCEDLMSGSSAGTPCTSATPSAAEAAEVARELDQARTRAHVVATTVVDAR